MSPTHRTESPGRPATVVAIDGPSGAGKSTVARALAKELGFTHLDTGAMYRAVTLFLLERGLDAASIDDATAAEALEELRLDLDVDGAVVLGGVRVGGELRTKAVESAVSAVSMLPSVRAALRDLQRAFAARGPVVCEGRDMGTVVFPDAPFKFFLDASVEERARRRLRDFEAAGRDVALPDVEAEIAARDAKDSGRDIAPLAAARDAVRVDTTGRGVAEVVELLAREVRAGAGATEGGA